MRPESDHRDNKQRGTRAESTRDVHFNCPADVYKQLRVYCALSDKSMTAVIIEALGKHLAENQQELAKLANTKLQ